jgi:hypothetical protein
VSECSFTATCGSSVSLSCLWPPPPPTSLCSHIKTGLCALSVPIFQARLPGASVPRETTTITETNKMYAHHMVRTDSSLQKLDKFFGSPTATATPSTR